MSIIHGVILKRSHIMAGHNMNNSFDFTGRLGADPETIGREGAGRRISLAVNTYLPPKEGETEPQKITDWFKVAFFAPHVVKKIDKLGKGDQVRVNGSVHIRTTGEGNDRQYHTNFDGNFLNTLSRKNGNSDTGGSATPKEKPAPRAEEPDELF
jgi:single-stranded DNA-binding protein